MKDVLENELNEKEAKKESLNEISSCTLTYLPFVPHSFA